MPDLRLREGTRYVALGTAPDDFMRGALSLCEGLASDYLSHFRSKGFAVEAPKDRMTIVALADPDAFGRFLGAEHPPQVTGIYEIDANYLVLFDGRAGGPSGVAAERANTITLFHEATHQLTYNSGLLDRASAFPLAIVEGLATYGEVRRPDGRTKIGAPNLERRAVLVNELRNGGQWIPLAHLLGDDELFFGDETAQLAYAQAWLLIYSFLRNKDGADRLRQYLAHAEATAQTSPPLDRVREFLGDPAELDEQLQGALTRSLKAR